MKKKEQLKRRAYEKLFKEEVYDVEEIQLATELIFGRKISLGALRSVRKIGKKGVEELLQEKNSSHSSDFPVWRTGTVGYVDQSIPQTFPGTSVQTDPGWKSDWQQGVTYTTSGDTVYPETQSGSSITSTQYLND